MAFNPDKCLCIHTEGVSSLGLYNVSGDPFYFSADGGSTWTPNEIFIHTNPARIYVRGTHAPKGYRFSVTPISDSYVLSPRGSVMSLIDDGAGTLNKITEERAFGGLFRTLNIGNLYPDLLPAMELSEYCYENMFEEATFMGTVVSGNFLPAQFLKKGCYQSMFKNSTGLLSIPGHFFGAQFLDEECYAGMFAWSDIQEIPKDLLPVESLAPRCYESMFQCCERLTTLPDLPAEQLADKCYALMFQRCLAIEKMSDNYLPANEAPTEAYADMFAGCTSLKNANMGATYLHPHSCDRMFFGCSSLKEIKVEFEYYWPDLAFEDWVYGVAEKGKFYCPENLIQLFDTCHIPVNWQVNPKASREAFSANFLTKYKIGGRAK